MYEYFCGRICNFLYLGKHWGWIKYFQAWASPWLIQSRPWVVWEHLKENSIWLMEPLKCKQKICWGNHGVRNLQELLVTAKGDGVFSYPHRPVLPRVLGSCLWMAPSKMGGDSYIEMIAIWHTCAACFQMPWKRMKWENVPDNCILAFLIIMGFFPPTLWYGNLERLCMLSRCWPTELYPSFYST